MPNQKKIVAIIVAYYPEQIRLKSLLEAICPQVFHVVLIDNTPIQNLDLSKFCSSFDSLELIRLGDNFGIAYAQNKGIEWAKAFGADYVLLLDQDSIPNRDMVSKLMMQYINNHPREVDLAAVGPAIYDRRSSLPSRFISSRFSFPFGFNTRKSKAKNSVEVSFLISSGSLISLSVLDKIGGYREDYFIDHVDTEWCLRAKSNGLKLLGVHDAILHHEFGDKVDKVFIGFKKNIYHHTPLRDYYMFRNTLLMLSDVYIPILWRIYLLIRLLLFTGYFFIFAGHRLFRIRLMLLGFFHGINGIRGRLDLNDFTCTVIPKIPSVTP